MRSGEIVFIGLSLSSSWGNGHATTYRALLRGLAAIGETVLFLERDVPWYAGSRDLPDPDFCELQFYSSVEELAQRFRMRIARAKAVIVGSYVPDGINVLDLVLEQARGLKAFYDIDTPITVSKLRSGDSEYLSGDQVPGFDLYFSFTGGPMLGELESRFSAKRAVPLYCSFDPDRYHVSEPDARFRCELSYMGTYAPDRQPKLHELLLQPARDLPDRSFIVAGPQYPSDIRWPKNVRHIVHVEPKFHPPFYSSSRFTLNLTRKDMVEAGYSPSVRLFEAAGCGAAMISDVWPGIETFFAPGKEILLADSSSEVVSYLTALGPKEVCNIGRRAQERVLAEHSAEKRAIQFEEFVGAKALARQYA
jgi:spore maturation protein CgeB